MDRILNASFLEVMATINCILILLNFIRKEVSNYRILDYLSRGEQRELAMYAILDVMKAERESTRTNRVEAVEAKKKAEEIAGTVVSTIKTESNELANKIEEVPIKVEQLLKDGPPRDTPSGRNKVVQPPTEHKE